MKIVIIIQSPLSRTIPLFNAIQAIHLPVTILETQTGDIDPDCKQEELPY